MESDQDPPGIVTREDQHVMTMLQRTRLLAWLLSLGLASPLPAMAQSATAPPVPAAPAQSSGTAALVFTPEQLEQVAAPIALYPDPLLAQVLMASTYPLEVVQAARFVKENPNLQGDQLNERGIRWRLIASVLLAVSVAAACGLPPRAPLRSAASHRSTTRRLRW
jgi:hypothetical protein